MSSSSPWSKANEDQPDDKRIVFRIGLHLGDLIVDGDDLYGDGVNMAARMEGEATPGGILLSGDFHNAVNGKVNATFQDLGPITLKNIDRPVQALRVIWDAGDWKTTPAGAIRKLAKRPLSTWRLTRISPSVSGRKQARSKAQRNKRSSSLHYDRPAFQPNGKLNLHLRNGASPAHPPRADPVALSMDRR